MQPVIGIDPSLVTAASATPEFKLGTVAAYDHPTLGNQQFVYGRANGAVTGRGFVCLEQNNYDFVMATSTTTNGGQSGHGSRVGVAMAALADDQYGWFQIYGRAGVRTLASAAVGTRLNTTATGGALDDDGTTGAEIIHGITLHVATGGAAAVNENAMLSYPTVGATL